MHESAPAPAKRSPPFSIRLDCEERARLEAEAHGAPLGTYIKAKVLGGAPLRSAASVQDRTALAQALALLGQSRFASNLNQIAHAANIGALVFTDEEAVALAAALAHVSEIRSLLLRATGIRKEV
jgi:hypothetical protein